MGHHSMFVQAAIEHPCITDPDYWSSNGERSIFPLPWRAGIFNTSDHPSPLPSLAQNPQNTHNYNCRM
jgi:hypothetical protein